MELGAAGGGGDAPAGVVLPAGPAAAAPLDDAIAAGVAQAAARGVTSYISVVDRATGQVVGETANAHTQVASESVMKLFIAGLLRRSRRAASGNLSASRREPAGEMIRFSDDGIASALFTTAVIPSMAQRYGLDRDRQRRPTPGTGARPGSPPTTWRCSCTGCRSTRWSVRG